MPESAANSNPWEQATPQVGYQSLSFLAVVSMVVGCGFGIVVLLGSIFAFVGTSPFLLPIWAVVFPLASLLTGWMALAKIRDSEGVLTGRAFAWTGINVSLVIGLLYFTYFMANNLAVRQQADDFIKGYFEAVSKEPFEKAFLYTLPPSQRPQTADPSNIRRFVESTYNQTQDMGQPGQFTRYQLEPYVRILSTSGGKFEARMVKANLPDYTEGGYVVPMTYEIKTDAVTIVIDFQVQSANTNRGREWFMKPTGVATRRLDLTPAGERLELQAKAANETAQKFIKALTRVKTNSFAAEPDFDAAFLLTTVGKPFAKGTLDPAALKKARELFFGPIEPPTAGRFIPSPGAQFYSDTVLRPKLLGDLGKAVTIGSGFTPYAPTWISISPEANLPKIMEADGVSKYSLEVNFFLVPRTTYNGRLIMVTEKGASPEDPNSWMIESVQLLRGKENTRSPDAPR